MPKHADPNILEICLVCNLIIFCHISLINNRYCLIRSSLISLFSQSILDYYPPLTHLSSISQVNEYWTRICHAIVHPYWESLVEIKHIAINKVIIIGKIIITTIIIFNHLSRSSIFWNMFILNLGICVIKIQSYTGHNTTFSRCLNHVNGLGKIAHLSFL